MSVELMSLVWAEHQGYLDMAEKAVLFKIADSCSYDGSSSDTDIEDMALSLSMDIDEVNRTISSLIQKELLSFFLYEKEVNGESFQAFKLNIDKMYQMCGQVRPKNY